MKRQSISVIIPCRNEEGFIEQTIRSVMSQDYPIELMEVLIADGMSDDQTCEVIENLQKEFPNLILLSNPYRVVPHALNACIKRSIGDVIVRLDAHSIYPNNYISRLVEVLEKESADNVGGVWITTPANNSLVAKAIAKATSNPFGIGDASYKQSTGGIREVDTVPFGCYRKDVFDRIGYFDEELVRNQDDELNGRLKQSGGKILIVPDVQITYFARPTVGKMMKMFFQYGWFKPLVNQKLNRPTNLRQFVPPLFIGGLLVGGFIGLIAPVFFWIWFSVVLIYSVTNSIVSLRIGLGESSPLMVLILPWLFFAIHASYGYGYLRGFVYHQLFRGSTSKSFNPSR